MDNDSPDDDQRFIGIAHLYGRSALERFQTAHVAVVGIGGVGSWVVEALARSGVGTLTLMDLDDICITNINRQIHSTDHSIGQSKITAMAERVRSINPRITVHLAEAFYGEVSADSFFSTPYDFIVDAIDSVRQKAHLLAEAHRRSFPVVTIGGAGGRIDPARIKMADLSQSSGDRLLMLVRKKLRQQYRFPRTGKGKFRIPCVYSDESPRYPAADGTVHCEREPSVNGGINCDSGLGSATHITASMGLFATGVVLNALKP